MGCGFATTAMAAPATVNDATTNTAITLNAAEGNTLDGHTFTFYRLGSYGDIIANGDKDVSSLTVLKIDDATDQWIAAANKTAGVTDYQLRRRGGLGPRRQHQGSEERPDRQ